MMRRLTIPAALLVLLLSACEDPSAEEFIRRAESYRQNGDIPASIIELKNALQKQPENARARFLLGQAYFAIRDLSGAEKELLRARDHGFPIDQLAVLLAGVWLDQQRYEKVLNELRVDAASTATHKTAVLIARGRAHQALGELEGAKQDFAAALAEEPESVDALVGLARVAMRLKDDSEAESAAARGSEIAPGDLNILAVTADLNFRRGDYSAAKANYEKILRARPGSIAVRLAVARTELALGQPEQAKAHLDLILARSSTHPDANYLRASLAIEAEDYEAAARLSEQVLIRKPVHGPSLLIAGVSNYILGRLDKAERLLLRLLAEDPSNNLAKQLHAAIRLRLDRSRTSEGSLSILLDDTVAPQQFLNVVDRAEQRHHILAAGQAYFESLAGEGRSLVLTWPPIEAPQTEQKRLQLRAALDAAPKDISILSDLGRLEVLVGNFAEAAAHFESAIRADPHALTPRILLGQLHLRLGRSSDALEVSQVALREHPKHPMLLALIGLAHLRKGKTQQAKFTLRDLVDVQPDLPMTHYLLSLVYRAEGERALYEDRLEQVLRLDASHLWARLARARLVAQSGDLESATMQVTELMESAAEDLDALDLAGSLALVRGEAEAAVARFRKAASKAPSSTRTLKLAYAQQRAGNEEGSRVTLQRWLRDFPADSDAHLVLANKYLNTNDLEQAQAHYAEIILLEPNNVVVLNNLAWVALQMGEIDMALDYGERAYLLAPEEARVLDTYGLAMLRAGKVEEAVKVLRRAQNTSSATRGIHLNLARALSQQGNIAEARKILDDLLSQNAEFPEKQEAEALMREIGR